MMALNLALVGDTSGPGDNGTVSVMLGKDDAGAACAQGQGCVKEVQSSRRGTHHAEQSGVASRRESTARVNSETWHGRGIMPWSTDGTIGSENDIEAAVIGRRQLPFSP